MNSPTASTRTRRSETRRDELLDAADVLFCARGVGATAVSDITDRAGVAKGTFYLYFDSKDHLVAALKERLLAGMSEVVAATLERARDGFESGQMDEQGFLALGDQVVAAIIDHWLAHRDSFRAVTESGESRETAQLMAEYDERVIQMLEAGVRIGAELGVVGVSDARRAAQFTYYGCQGVTKAALLAPGEVDRDTLVAGSQELIRRIMTA